MNPGQLYRVRSLDRMVVSGTLEITSEEGLSVTVDPVNAKKLEMEVLDICAQRPHKPLVCEVFVRISGISEEGALTGR